MVLILQLFCVMFRTAGLEIGTLFSSTVEEFKYLYSTVFDHFILLQLRLKKSPQVFFG